jgi:hypothetical protein
MGLMMLFFAIFRRQILNSTVASEAFSLIWIHGARYGVFFYSRQSIDDSSVIFMLEFWLLNFSYLCLAIVSH